MFDVDVKESEEDTVLRMFRIAKSRGCKFYLGTDAHHPTEFDGARMKFERAIKLLELTDEDRFFIKK